MKKIVNAFITLTDALNQKEKGKPSKRITNIKLFMNKYN